MKEITSVQDFTHYFMSISIASKTEENIPDAPGVISVITQDELKRFGGTTLADVLKRVPSFLGSSVYMTDRSMIAARGDQIMQSSSHILLLLNGRPMREILEGGIKSEVYESFPVSVIERIEVIRGPGSVLHGTQAFSAVINVITKSPENNTVSVSGALGEHLHNNISTDVQYKLGDFGVVLAARYADKGGWKTQLNAPANPPWTPVSLHHIDITIPDYGPGAYAEVNWKDLRLMCSYNQWENQNFMTPYEYLNTIGAIKDHATVPIGWKKLFGDIGYKREFTKWYNASFNVTYTRSLFEVQRFPSISRDSYEVLGELTNFFTPFRNFNIIAGGVLGYMTGLEKNFKDDRLYYNKGHKGTSLSGYAQTDYHWDFCKIIGGIQVNKVDYKDSLGKVDNFDADFNPRAGVILYPLEHINIKALYSTAYRAPSLNELYLDNSGIAGKMTHRDDPHFALWNHEDNLKPEKVHTFDLGANYQDDNVQFGINGFHSRMKNIIAQCLDTNRYSINTYDNLGEVSIFGLECEAKYYLTRSLFFEGSFLYQQSRNEITGDVDVALMPNFSAKGGLSYQSEIGLTASAFNTFQQSVNTKYYDPYNKNVGYFNMTNVHCCYDLNRLLMIHSVKELSLVLNIDNLLNQEVWLEIQVQPLRSSVPYNQGRTIYGGFKVTF